MAIDTQRVSLDISKQPAIQVVRLGQGDANGTTLVCAIYDEGQAYDLTGKTVRLRIQLPGGYAEYHVDGAVSGNEATFNVNEAYAASVAGITDNAYVEVIQGGAVVCSTSRFRVVILPSAYEGTDPAHIWDNGVNAFLQSANAQVRELTQDATQAIDAAANAESSAAAELNAALDALGDISEIAVPLMSATTRGGAMLGSGLAVTDGKLHTQLVQGADSTANAAIQANGDLLHGLTVDGMSVQDGTPTPSAPVPVQVVDGANLLDAGLPSEATSHSVTVTPASDGWFSISGTATGTSSGVLTVWASTDLSIPEGIYTAVVETQGTPFVDNLIRLQFYGGSALAYASGAGSYQLDASAGVTRIGIHFAAGSAGSAVNGKFRVAIYPGTTSASYVPYGSLGVKVRGRNLLAYEASALSNGVMHTYDGTGACTIKGTATGASAISVANALAAGSVMLPAGTYTVSCWATPGYNTGSGGGVRADVYSAASTLLVNTERVSSATGAVESASFTLSTATEVTIRANVGSNSVVDGTCYIQLESGSTAHEYTPYIDSTTPIPLQSNVLASLPDGTHDELAVDELGRVKLVKRVGVITFDGSSDEVWSTQSNGNRIATSPEWPWTSTDYPKQNASATAVANLLSTRFQAASPSTLANATVGVSINNVSYGAGFAPILFSDGNGGMTAEAWNTWLQSNPVTVYYPLATPTTIDLGTIDPPKLADGATIEALANLDTGVSADWWAVGAGAVGDGLVKLRDMLTALGAGE